MWRLFTFLPIPESGKFHILNQGCIQEFFPGGAFIFFLGGRSPLGFNNPLKIIDFNNPRGGLRPYSPSTEYPADD